MSAANNKSHRHRSKKKNESNVPVISAERKSGGCEIPKGCQNQDSQNIPDKISGVNENKDITENFIVELKWCLQQLENDLKCKSRHPKQAEELRRSYKILASGKQPMVKKRQIMRGLFGDYREKMMKDVKQFEYDPPKFRKSAMPESSKFIRKATATCNSLNFTSVNSSVNASSNTLFTFNFHETLADS